MLLIIFLFENVEAAVGLGLKSIYLPKMKDIGSQKVEFCF